MNLTWFGVGTNSNTGIAMTLISFRVVNDVKSLIKKIIKALMYFISLIHENSVTSRNRVSNLRNNAYLYSIEADHVCTIKHLLTRALDVFLSPGKSPQMYNLGFSC